MNLFDKFNSWLNNVEVSVVNTVSIIAPWLAPLIPAYLTHKHSQSFLSFSTGMAWVSACVVELLGFSTVSTVVSFWKHNQKYKDKKNHSPLWLAVGAFTYYLLVVLAVNVLLSIEYYSTRALIAITLLTTLSLPAAVTIAIRSQHSETKKQISKRYKSKSNATNASSNGHKSKIKAIAKCPQCEYVALKETQKQANLAISAHMKKHKKEKEYD